MADENAQMKCPFCGAEVADNASFCSACGASLKFGEEFSVPVEGSPAAPYPTAPSENDLDATIRIDTIPDIPASPVETAPTTPSRKKINPLFIIAPIALVALVVAGLFIFGVFGKLQKPVEENDVPPYYVFIKDGEIWIDDLSGNGAIQLTENLTNSELVADDTMRSSVGMLADYVVFAEDSSVVFYPDYIPTVDEETGILEGVPMFYRDLSRPEIPASLIDTEIDNFSINRDGTKIIYTKYVQGDGLYTDLYTANLIDGGLESMMLDTHVSYYHTTEDCSRTVYGRNDESFILITDEEKTVLADGVYELCRYNEELTDFYYLSTTGLFHQVVGDGAKREMIASDVTCVCNVLASGEIYFTVGTSHEVSYYDLIVDDMLETDLEIEQPVEPEYPDAPVVPLYEDYETAADYEAAVAAWDAKSAAYEEDCAALDEAFSDQYALWEAKQYREDFREFLKSNFTDITSGELWYYNGSITARVTDNLYDPWNVLCAGDAACALVELHDESEDDKLLMSELDSGIQDDFNSDELFDHIREGLNGRREWFVGGPEIYQLPETNAWNWTIASDGSEIHYVEVTDDVNEIGELYMIKVENGNPGEPVCVDVGISTFCAYYVGKHFTYIKNFRFDEYLCDLYIDGNLINTDVEPYSIRSEGDLMCYYIEFDAENCIGTLELFKDGHTTEIGRNVSDFRLYADGSVVMFKNYDVNTRNGEFWIMSADGDETLVAEDCVGLLPVSNSEIHGGSFYGFIYG